MEAISWNPNLVVGIMKDYCCGENDSPGYAITEKQSVPSGFT